MSFISKCLISKIKVTVLKCLPYISFCGGAKSFVCLIDWSSPKSQNQEFYVMTSNCRKGMQNAHNFNQHTWEALQIVCVLGSHHSTAPCWAPSFPSPPYLILPGDCAGRRELSQDDTEKSKMIFLGESISPTWHKNGDQEGFP